MEQIDVELLQILRMSDGSVIFDVTPVVYVERYKYVAEWRKAFFVYRQVL